jgi:hypothetical protein
MEMCIENGVDDYELRSEVDGCPLSPQAEGQVRTVWARSRVLILRCCFISINLFVTVIECSLLIL